MSAAPSYALPVVLNGIAEAIDLETALTLARDFGGVRLYVPRRLSRDHDLVQSLGHEQAVKLCEYLGWGTVIDVPLGPESAYGNIRQTVISLLDSDERLTEHDIARKARTSARYVRRIKQDIRAPRPPDLFD